MKRLIALLILLGLLQIPAFTENRLETIVYPELSDFSLPQLQKTELTNKMKLRVIKSTKVPLVHLIGFFKGGKIYTPTDRTGLSTILADMLRIGGTGKISPSKLDELLESKGIEIDITDENNYYSVSMSCLKSNLEEAVGILADMLMDPGFAKDKFVETKTRLLSNISRRNDDPSKVSTREFKHIIYGRNSPFSPQMEYSHLMNIKLTDVKKAWEKYITPDNFIAGLSGPVTIKEVRRLFDDAFRDWNRTSKLDPYPVVKTGKRDFKVGFTPKKDINQSYICIGHLGQVEDLKIKGSIELFNRIFGLGFGCRLFNKIRTRLGLTYGIYGGIFTRLLYPGINFFVTYTKTGSTVKAVNAIIEEVRKIRQKPVSGKELKEARDFFINSFVFKYRTPAKILRRKLINEFFSLSEDYDEKLLQNIKNADKKDILKVAGEFLDPDKFVIYVLGDETLLNDLEKLGKVKIIDISIPAPPGMKKSNQSETRK